MGEGIGSPNAQVEKNLRNVFCREGGTKGKQFTCPTLARVRDTTEA